MNDCYKILPSRSINIFPNWNIPVASNRLSPVSIEAMHVFDLASLQWTLCSYRIRRRIKSNNAWSPVGIPTVYLICTSLIIKQTELGKQLRKRLNTIVFSVQCNSSITITDRQKVRTLIENTALFRSSIFRWSLAEQPQLLVTSALEPAVIYRYCSSFMRLFLLICL